MANFNSSLLRWVLAAAIVPGILMACETQAELSSEGNTVTAPGSSGTAAPAGGPVLLVIDEEGIDNGSLPNLFSDTDVNDALATVGQRQPLRFFRQNLGRTIDLYSGEVGDEGFHAITTIPANWKTAGASGNGARNFLLAAPGLGGGTNNPEVLLDKIPNVIPLRAKGLAMLKGQTVLAVVYDGNIGTNYDPLNANLQGANLGTVALQIINVSNRTDGSSGSLPKVTVKIVQVEAVATGTLKLFSNAPVPLSSSEPSDVSVPATVPAAVFVDAQ